MQKIIDLLAEVAKELQVERMKHRKAKNRIILERMSKDVQVLWQDARVLASYLPTK